MKQGLSFLVVAVAMVGGCSGGSQLGTNSQTGSGAVVASQDSEAGFIEAYKAAHRKRDLQAALKLVYWKDVSPAMRDGTIRVFRRNFRQRLTDATLIDAPVTASHQLAMASGTMHPTWTPQKS